MKSSTGYAPNAMETQCLVLLARLGRLLPRHLHLAWPTTTLRNAYIYLNRLSAAGLVAYIEHFEAPPANRRTRKNQLWKRHGRIYSLTPLGWDYLKASFPHLEETNERLAPTYFNPRHQAEHQIEYADLVTSIIRDLDTIPGMVGMSSYIEMDLSEQARPRADGIIVLRRWKNATLHADERSSCYPWLIVARQEGQIDELFAIEIDRGTEEASIITGKARSYGELYDAGSWKKRFQWPLIAFAVPTERRQQVIFDAWDRGWPGGPIRCTTFDAIHAHGALAPIWTHQQRIQGERILHANVPLLRSSWAEAVIA
ncbi:replication-relaxation family protein [Herpetosiphon llansteffanensis]|uniref:replication-relaxation family protein n=1 Tax=Herpetosiphon llansteffanensis TaxID=2094568 RepID=UPI000D7C8F6C|nr:replication-relaxation family protein [Herpetosiphon llansteffanensis]